MNITPEILDRNLAIRDLTDPEMGSHALQQIVSLLHGGLAKCWGSKRLVYRSCPIVTVKENYDRLGYPPEGVSRDARYTRYITRDVLLRTHTSAIIPALLSSLALHPPDDLLLVCPGLVYRRDVIDRLHVGEPHQVDLWRIKSARLDKRDLHEMIDIVVTAVVPGYECRTVKSLHAYTLEGVQVDVKVNGKWVEIGECGVANPKLLAKSGLPETIGGLAMGLGLDRLLMIRKEIDDIRLLRSTDPRVAIQMQNLDRYQPVSNQPAIQRDLSLCVSDDLSPEEVGDRVREVMDYDLDSLESLEIISETSYTDLPEPARERMGMLPRQKNILVRLLIRHSTKTLIAIEANRIRDRVYLALHEGKKMELTM